MSEDGKDLDCENPGAVNSEADSRDPDDGIDASVLGGRISATIAARDGASLSSLQRLSAEASLEAHGYEAVRRLAGSTTATVMIVHRLGLADEHFVVKTMSLRGLDAKGRLRALQEIQLLRRLRHPNIVHYIESWWNGVGPDSGRLTVVMECAENGDLRVPVVAAIQSGKHLEEVLIMSWLQQMLQALAHIHEKKIVHRDLKAMNIFLKDTWRTCLLGDFGISTALRGSENASGCVGTPAYMAPELVWNQRYASPVDMWAVGVVLYELMALKVPFSGTSLLGLVYQIAFKAHEEAALREADYSVELVTLVSRLLNKDPPARPTAAELLGTELLWDTFCDESVRGFALASFSASQWLPSAGSSGRVEGEGTHGDRADADVQSGLVDASSSSWGSALALQTGASQMGADVVDGSSCQPAGPSIGLDTAFPGTATATMPSMMATAVSDEALWDELRRTRHESDTVPPERYDSLVASICSTLATSRSTGTSIVADGRLPREDLAVSNGADFPASEADSRDPDDGTDAGVLGGRLSATITARDGASLSSLQRLSAEASLEAHGYEAVRRLAGSTTATVMIVHRLGLADEHFVVKTMSLRGLDAKGRLRALQEIQLLRRLRHPNIVHYIESWWNGVGPDSGRLTVVMECAENGDLRVPVVAAIQSGKHLEEVLIMSWLKQMLQALAHIHEKKIVHRDLKAMNIFLKDTWRTCLLGDFGISTALRGSENASGCVGTPAYMAPELVWNQRYASPVDMWAVGVVLYELMALKVPFSGTSLLGLVYQIAFKAHEEAALREADYSVELVTLVSRLLNKDPPARPTAAELLGTELLWDTFCDESVRGFALASFSASQWLPSAGSSGRVEGEGTHGDRADADVQSGLVDASSSSWGSALALQTGASQMGADVVDGSSCQPAGPSIGLDTAFPGTATATMPSMMATAVSDEALWDELRRTRHESDTVPLGRYEALMARLVHSDQDPSASRPAPSFERPVEHMQDPAELVAQVKLFLERRGIQPATFAV
ncbi:unnamed protein product [Polarella glacialis]|uniref:non-specific serine/threonine protein kinase n=1 Tax=Polarella glacialis TaxID=89957 RepID=A0A813GAX4_POLGL|nr:unnamed protein product [Polarella glacialis]